MVIGINQELKQRKDWSLITKPMEELFFKNMWIQIILILHKGLKKK